MYWCCHWWWMYSSKPLFVLTSIYMLIWPPSQWIVRMTFQFTLGSRVPFAVQSYEIRPIVYVDFLTHVPTYFCRRECSFISTRYLVSRHVCTFLGPAEDCKHPRPGSYVYFRLGLYKSHRFIDSQLVVYFTIWEDEIVHKSSLSLDPSLYAKRLRSLHMIFHYDPTGREGTRGPREKWRSNSDGVPG